MIIDYLKLTINTNINYFKNIFKINKQVISIMFCIFKCLEYLVNKLIYILFIIISYKYLNTFISFEKYAIFITLIGGLFNSIILKKDKILHVLINKYNQKCLLSIYTFKIIFNYVPLILFFIIKQNSFYNMFIFLLLNKNIFNYIYVKMLDKNILYNEEYISIKKMFIAILMLFIIMTSNINILLNCLNIIAFFCTIKIYTNKNIDKIYLYLKQEDFYFKESIILNKNVVKEYEDPIKYIANIFFKRYRSQYVMYSIRQLFVVVLMYLLNKEIFCNENKIIFDLLAVLLLSNSIFKMIDLYYYKCDYYLLLKKELSLRRVIELILVMLPSVIFIFVIMFNNSINTIYYFIALFILFLINISLYKCYEVINIFADKHKNKRYYIIEFIIFVILCMI